MKYVTLKNMERATKMIADKGYTWTEANNMAINCFAMCASWGYQNPVEYYIDKILTKEEHEEEYGKQK